MDIWRRIFESAISERCTSRTSSTSGYFAVPTLSGDRLVGKLDATATCPGQG